MGYLIFLIMSKLIVNLREGGLRTKMSMIKITLLDHIDNFDHFLEFSSAKLILNPFFLM